MTDKVKKIFEILGVKPNEEFEVMLKDRSDITYKFKFDENLQGYFCHRDKWFPKDNLLHLLLNGHYKIIELPKKKKKKLRDLTPEEYDKWLYKNCGDCSECIFRKVMCADSCYQDSWINNKDKYSEKFLNQEIELAE